MERCLAGGLDRRWVRINAHVKSQHSPQPRGGSPQEVVPEFTMIPRSRRSWLLHGKSLDFAINLTTPLMVLGFVYIALGRWLGGDDGWPGMLTAAMLILVGAGTGTIEGSRRYMQSILARCIAAVLTMIVGTIAVFFTRGAIEMYFEPAGQLLFDSTIAAIWLWWGAYLFLSVALQVSSPDDVQLRPRIKTPTR